MAIKKRSDSVKKLTLSAIFTALGTIILTVGVALGPTDLTAVAFASFFVYFAYIEMRSWYPWMIWAATSILTAILMPGDGVALLTYILFGGVYPIFKALFEKLHPVLSWIVKLSYFNTVLSLIIGGSLLIFHVDPDEIGFTGVAYLLGNLVFVLYDIAMSKLILLYLVKLRNRLGIKKFFES